MIPALVNILPHGEQVFIGYGFWQFLPDSRMEILTPLQQVGILTKDCWYLQLSKDFDQTL